MTRQILYAITTRSRSYQIGSLNGFSVGRNQDEAIRSYAKREYNNHKQTEAFFRRLKKQLKLVKVEVPAYRINLEDLVID
jgi:hypothetical protein